MVTPITVTERLRTLDNSELEARLKAYSGMQAQIFRVLCERQAADSASQAIEDGAAKGIETMDDPDMSERSAKDWIEWITREAFTPEHQDPAVEIARLKRYVLTASLTCAEAGDLPEDNEKDEA